MTERPDEVRSLRAELARQRRLSERLRRTQESERAAVAHAVHDTIGQTLSAMKMQLHEAARGGALPEATRARLSELEGHVDTLLDEARRIASSLRPGVLDHFGLARALDAALDGFAREHGIDARLENPNHDPERLPGEVETTLLRIVELALDNVARHARAGTVSVSFDSDADGVMLSVHDDGQGFAAGALNADDALGLLDMQSRAEAIGGTCTIDSDPGRGTTVTVRLPAQARGEAKGNAA